MCPEQYCRGGEQVEHAGSNHQGFIRVLQKRNEGLQYKTHLAGLVYAVPAVCPQHSSAQPHACPTLWPLPPAFPLLLQLHQLGLSDAEPKHVLLLAGFAAAVHTLHHNSGSAVSGNILQDVSVHVQYPVHTPHYYWNCLALLSNVRAIDCSKSGQWRSKT